MILAGWPIPEQPDCGVEDCGTCHSCHEPIADVNASPVAETCGDCLTDCLCPDCREVRWQIGEDRAEQAAFDASREAS